MTFPEFAWQMELTNNPLRLAALYRRHLVPRSENVLTYSSALISFFVILSGCAES